MTVRRALYWSFPSLFCVVLYWYGLKAWFQMDDFAWLGLHRFVTDFDSFVSTVFRPMAQGTVRPLSERLFFLTFWQIFGMEALPYRCFVFGTQFVNLILITLVTRRLTGSAAAGVLAPLLWLASPILYEPMVWTSAYNQILCSFFLLLAFYLLLQWTEAGSRRYYIGMWVAFLLGFGALELNVVFPALAALYLAFHARRYLPGITPMFLVSIGYAVLHRRAARGHSNDTYAMDFHPGSLLAVFWQYVQMSFSAFPMGRVSGVSTELLLAAGAAALLALLWFAVFMIRRGDRVALFLLAWFVITIGPYLSLSRHISDYYLTVPMIGIAMLGGWAIAVAWQAGTAARIVAVVAAALFVIPGCWQSRYMTRLNSDNSRRVRSLVRGLAAAHKLHPEKIIVLSGIDNSLFWGGIYDRPQLALGWDGLYLTSEAQRLLTDAPTHIAVNERFLPESVTLDAIRSGLAVVYDVTQGRLRNITDVYQRTLTMAEPLPLPNLLDAGSRMYRKYLKDGWYTPADGYAWTSKAATVELRGPLSSPGKLGLNGFVSPLHTEKSPLDVIITANGKRVGALQIPVGGTEFHMTCDLPKEFIGARSLLINIAVDRTVTVVQDPRAFGLLFGSIEVTP